MSLAGNIFVPLLLLLHLASGAFGAVFLPPGQVVADQKHNFTCQSSDKKPISCCYFQVPGFKGEIKIFDNVNTPRYAFAGEGLQKGECGLRLRPVYRNNTGQYKCRLILDDFSEQTASTQVDVLDPVDHVGINSNSKLNDYEYKENELMQINCTAVGNPEPKLTLFIGDEKLKETQGCTLVFKTEAKPKYHYKDLKCEAEQPQLHCQIADDRKLTVSFAPRLLETSNVIMWNQVTVLDGKATIQVWSHPPTVERRDRLTRNGDDVNVNSTKLKDKPITEYSWPIENEADLRADWKLEVSNSVGTAVFNLTLVAPLSRREEVSNGFWNAVTEVFLLLLLLLGLAVVGVILLWRKLHYQKDQRRKTERRQVYKIFDKVYILTKCQMPELDSNIVRGETPSCKTKLNSDACV